MDEENQPDEEEFVARFLAEDSEEPKETVLPSLETFFENDWLFAAFLAVVLLVGNILLGQILPLDMLFLLFLTEAFISCTIFIWMFLTLRKIK